MTLENLLRMTVPVPAGCVAPEGSPMSPEFRVAVQEIAEDGVRIIIHANGHNSETLDRWVIGEFMLTLDEMKERRRLSQPVTDDQIKYMVERFLGWRLPEDFMPDAGISFKADYNEHTAYPAKHEPVGTNLFTATQAEQMIRYLVDGIPKDPGI